MPEKPRTECKFCLKPMPPKDGKFFCNNKCKSAYWNNPHAAGKKRKGIERIVRDVLRAEGLIQ